MILRLKKYFSIMISIAVLAMLFSFPSTAAENQIPLKENAGQIVDN